MPEVFKKVEFAISDGTISCDECNRTIPTDQPYAIKRRVEMTSGDIVIVARNECLHLCGEIRTAARPGTEPVPAKISPRKPLPEVRSEWDSLPDVAGPNEQDNFPIYNLQNERVANGYNAIVPFTDDVVFLECAEAQVNKAQFSLDAGESTDIYQQMVTPGGFFCRRYLKTSGDCIAGRWYFRLNFVVPSHLRSKAG